MTFLYLFNFVIRKVSNINITLKHLLLEIFGKRFDKKKALFKCFYRIKSLEKPKSLKKNRIVLEKLGLIM